MTEKGLRAVAQEVIDAELAHGNACTCDAPDGETMCPARRRADYAWEAFDPKWSNPGRAIAALNVIRAAREALVVMEGISDTDLYRAEKKLRAAIKKWDGIE